MYNKKIDFGIKAYIPYKGNFLVMHNRGEEQNLWELPGGRMEFGETAEEALVRELKEETGLIVEPIKILDSWNVMLKEDYQITGMIYLCELVEGEIQLSEEHDDYRWIPAEKESVDLLYECFRTRMINWKWEINLQQGENTESIEEVTKETFEEYLGLGLKLWPEATREKLSDEFKELLDSAKHKSFLYKAYGEYIGLIIVSLRSDYVEGGESSPVGYLEGIYVEADYRKKSIGKQLLKKGEEWAKENGCTEFASDIEQHNTVSYDFHINVGFREANRLICFIKDIK